MEVSITFAHYGEERELNATDGEWQMYEQVIKLISDCGGDLSIPRLVRVSDNYVSVKYGDWDVARMKYTDRAKWIVFPTVETKAAKHRITSPEEVLEFHDMVADTLEHIKKYSEE